MMEALRLFEEWDSVNEGMMSEIDLIGREAETVDAFKKEVKEFLSKHDPKAAEDDAAIDALSKSYFDEAGKKIQADEAEVNEASDAEILPQMVDVSNNSQVTRSVAAAIAGKLDEQEFRDFKTWLRLVKQEMDMRGRSRRPF